MADLWKFLEVHASGALVTRKIPFKSPVLPQILNGHVSDEQLRVADSRLLHSREFLFMPVQMSPILIYLIGKPWHHRITDSFAVIYQLWIIGRAYSNPNDPYYQMNKETIDKARTIMMEEMTVLDEKIHDYFHSPEGKQLEKDDFVKYMQIATIDRIHILEKCLQSCFHFHGFPPLRTPYEFPTLAMLPKEAQSKYWEHLAHYYNLKQVIRVDRFKKECGLEEEKEYFPSLRGAFNSDSYDTLLREYYNYLKEE